MIAEIGATLLYDRSDKVEMNFSGQHFFKKNPKEFDFTTMKLQIDLFFVGFSEEIEDTKKDILKLTDLYKACQTKHL